MGRQVYLSQNNQRYANSINMQDDMTRRQANIIWIVHLNNDRNSWQIAQDLIDFWKKEVSHKIETKQCIIVVVGINITSKSNTLSELSINTLIQYWYLFYLSRSFLSSHNMTFFKGGLQLKRL